MTLDLGFVALTDAAPLIIAQERDFFSEEGLDVRLHREVSWATVRDKLAAGVFHGAHLLAPLAIAMRLGVGSDPTDIIAPMSLNAHGAAIGVSAALSAEMGELSAIGLARAAAKRLGRGDPQITFGTVFPYSMHAYMLRYWVASAGLDPDRDIRILTAPPTSILDRLQSSGIDGFCVGAPWGAVCEDQGGAGIVLEAADFWPGAPDKVLALPQAWADREPEATQALLRALLRASIWADAPENLEDLARLLSQPHCLNAPHPLIAQRLGRSDTAIRFARNAAFFPWQSHAAWIFSQMLRWGQVDPVTNPTRTLECYRPDLVRAAASDLGMSAPIADSKPEGAYDGPWALPGSRGPIPMLRDTFMDGARFDPQSLREYAAGFAVTRLIG